MNRMIRTGAISGAGLIVLLLIVATAGAQEPFSHWTGPLEGMEFVLIPAGEFMMGSPDDEFERDIDESPMHRVTVPSFYIMSTEVTNRMWNELMPSNPSYFQSKGETCPVETVSWFDVHDFLDRLNEHDSLYTYRLPTEAEWEYACRAGTTTPYYTGSTLEDFMRAGWNEDNSDRQPHPVAEKEPNPWGLYDMHGNIDEWVEDWDHSTYEGAPSDGSAWVNPEGIARVIRSGSWCGRLRYQRSANRYRHEPEARLNHIGFRVVREVNPR